MATRRCLRPKQRISYFEPDEPDLDEYVYCESCMDYVYEYCSIHGALLVIPDDKVPAKHNFPSFVPRAALTIPRVFLHLNYSSIPGAGLGVFATLTLPKGVRFGPYRGVKTKQVDDTDYSWQLYDGLRRPSHVVDAADGDASNWMRFVNCARHWREQNLVAFQYRGELYYRTIKVIPRHTELLVFYGSQFANKLHIDLGRYNAPPTYAHKFGAPVTKKKKTEEGKSTQIKDVIITVENNTKNKKKKQSKTESTKNNYGVYSKKVKVNNIDVLQTTNKTTDIKIVVSKQNVVDNVIANIPSRNNSLCLKGEKIQKSIPLSDVYFTCNECNYKTITKEILIKHLRYHDSNRQHVCDICGYRYFTNMNLNQHKLCHTTNETSMTIPNIICNVKLYSCSKCDYKSSRAGNLKTHLRTHTGEKPYSCNKCDYKSSHAWHLKTHLRTHTGEKPYSCNKCDYKSSRAGHLKTHLRTHTGEKPYSCNKCNYKSSDARNLKRHVRIHTRENPS